MNEKAHSQSKANNVTKKQKVLFVDDERKILTSLERLLRSEPYRSFFVQSGQEALDLLKGRRVNVIVSDLAMPGMDGLTLLKQVQQKYPDVICLVMSGQADKNSILSTIKLGSIYRFIVKPWDNNEIKRIISQAVEISIQKEKKNLLEKIEEHKRA